MAVIEESRGQGIGRALIEAVAETAALRFPGLALNVHLLNPAARLYVETGFRVVGAGRGWYGVAMQRTFNE